MRSDQFHHEGAEEEIPVNQSTVESHDNNKNLYKTWTSRGPELGPDGSEVTAELLVLVQVTCELWVRYRCA